MVTLGTLKSLKLGSGPKTAHDFREAVKNTGLHIGDTANDLLDKPGFVFSSHETEVDIVFVHAYGLGLNPREATFEDFCARAKGRGNGLVLCPVEVGPQMLLQYKQPKGEFIVIASESIVGSNGHPYRFILYNNDAGHVLSAYNGYPDWIPGEAIIVFARNK